MSSEAPTKYEVFEILVEEILSNKLQPGQALVERTLADRFGISRTPIREALRRLQSEYLVNIYPNQGAFVRRFSEKDARDLFHLREVLEPLAASLAAENRPDDEIAECLADMPSIDEVVNHATSGALTTLGLSYHDAIVSWADNRLLIDTYLVLRKQTRLVRTITQTSHAIEVTSFLEHRAILEAIRDRASSTARHLMTQHLKRTNAEVLKLLAPSP